MRRVKTADAARGKWKGILQTLGVERSVVAGKHGPCPFPQCGGGRDRFRFDDQDGSGSFICSACGAGGSGFAFLEKLKGWDFATAAAEVDKVVGNVIAEAPRPALDPAKRSDSLNRLWKSGEPVQLTDPVGLYLQSRGVPLPPSRDCIRFVSYCPAPGESGGRNAMVAKVLGPDGRPVTLHRTFLTPVGRKADMDSPRAVMPGEIAPGSAIRLCPPGDTLGIAEGIETALAAHVRFGIPVWAAINATMLAKWEPPAGVSSVVVFIDNDPKFGGQATGFALAHRLATRAGMLVKAEIPPVVGTDWADIREAA